MNFSNTAAATARLCPFVETHADQLDLYWLAHNPAAGPWWAEQDLGAIPSNCWTGLSTIAAPQLLRQHLDELDWDTVACNPDVAALRLFFARFPDPADMSDQACCNLSANPAAVGWLQHNLDKVHWPSLCANRTPEAMQIVRQHLDRAHWPTLSCNPAAVELLAAFPEKVDWCEVGANAGAMPLICAHLARVIPTVRGCTTLSSNPSAMPLLLDRPDLIEWDGLSSNPDPKAVSLLAANLRFVHWRNLCANPSSAAIALIAQHPHRACWDTLSENPCIFVPADATADNS